MLLLDEKNIHIIEDILTKHNLLNRAYYFGSRIKGTHRTNSDIDVCLKSKETISTLALMNLQEDLSNSDLTVKIDVVVWDKISDDFKQKIEKSLTPAGWKEVRLGDVCLISPNVKITKGKYVPFVEMAQLNPIDRNVCTINTRIFKSGTKFENGDTLMARITPCLENGKVCQYKGVSPAFGSTEFNILRGKKEITDNNFVYYFSTSSAFHSYAVSHMSGTSGRQRCSANFLKDFILSLPPLDEQQRIAEVLSSLDDKIENNRNMNKTLENMAKALFKSWFVDFDPVHALASGENKNAICKRLYIDKETLALFPDTFDAQGLPMGWEMKPLDEVFDYTMGQSPSGNSFNDKQKGTLFFQGRAEFTWRYPTPRLYTTQPKRMANKDDILFSVRAPVGDINIALENCCIGRGLCSICHKKSLQSYGLYVMLSVADNIKSIYDTEGTVFGSINKIELGKWNLISPLTTICQEFNKMVSTMDNKIETNQQENQTLTNIRDTLLPALISGKVRVNA